MEAGVIIGTLVGIILATIFNSIVFWIVSKLGLGISIEKFGTAIVGALLAAVLGVMLSMLTHDWKGMFSGHGASAFLHTIGTAIIIIIVSKILPGMTTKGLWGAILSAVAIGLVGWLLNKILSSFI